MISTAKLTLLLISVASVLSICIYTLTQDWASTELLHVFSTEQMNNSIFNDSVPLSKKWLQQTTQARTYHETNTHWVNRVREYCADYKKSVNVYPGYVGNFGLPTYVWIASEYHHLFYCAAPKCSSTTWVTYIMQDQNMTWTGDNHA